MPVFMPNVAEAYLPRTEMEMYEKEPKDEVQRYVQGDSETFCSSTGLYPLS